MESVRVTDSTGGFRLATLFFGSAGQINYLVPEGTADGLAKVSVEMSGEEMASGTVQINPPLPRTLSGRGEVDVTLTVDGLPANVVTVSIQ